MFSSHRQGSQRKMSSLGAVARGVTASALGTLAMDSFLSVPVKEEL
jgi:hypothetical protein